MGLSPCPSCARHVRNNGGTCPFCEHELPVPNSARAQALARARFGAMLVGAATISTLTGCPRPMTKYGAPPLPTEQPEAKPGVDAPEADATPDAPEADTPEADAPEAEAPEAEAP